MKNNKVKVRTSLKWVALGAFNNAKNCKIITPPTTLANNL